MEYPKASAVYSLCIGMLMTGMWTFFLVTGQVPELEGRPVEILLHLVVEFTTAVLLIISGITTLIRRKRGGALMLFSFGMLTYTLIQSPGYYAQRGEIAFVVMFAVLFLATAFFTLRTIKKILFREKAGLPRGRSPGIISGRKL